MNREIFSNIGKIIERDSKYTTYKFALLRGVIDLIQENSPYISFSINRAHFPIGLLIEKWMLYYYPILESATSIPQINGDANLAFGIQLKKLISLYSDIGGFSAFYNDLTNKGIPEYIQSDFLALVKKLKHTITKMPMRYIGRSISNDYYSIFQYTPAPPPKKTSEVELGFLINNFGSFSIPMEYYEALRILGNFVNGMDSILLKWAEFSVNASGKNLSIEKVINEVLKSPITEKDAEEAKKIYKSILHREGKVYCVWTGRSISHYEVDHMIPFSVWKNNDLWNLLPSQAWINNKKRDKIPSVDLIEKRKDLIIHYWNLLNEYQSNKFLREIKLALLGDNTSADWQLSAFNRLKMNCDYLISNRGFEEWRI